MDVLVRSCRPGGWLVLLVKPQFEAGRAEVSRGRGVITDPVVWRAVLDAVVAAATAAGASMMEVMVSPLRGADGNAEFLLHLRRESSVATVHPDADARRTDVLDRVVASAAVGARRAGRHTMSAIGLVLHRGGRPSWRRRPSTGCRSRDHEVRLADDDAAALGVPELGVDAERAGGRPGPGAEPGRRRHHAARGRPGRRRRRPGARREPGPARLPHRGRAVRGAHGAQAVPRRLVLARGADAPRRRDRRAGRGRDPARVR